MKKVCLMIIAACMIVGNVVAVDSDDVPRNLPRRVFYDIINDAVHDILAGNGTNAAINITGTATLLGDVVRENGETTDNDTDGEYRITYDDLKTARGTVVLESDALGTLTTNSTYQSIYWLANAAITNPLSFPVKTKYSELRFVAVDTTSNSLDGAVDVYGMVAGTDTQLGRFAAAGLDLVTGSVEAKDLWHILGPNKTVQYRELWGSVVCTNGTGTVAYATSFSSGVVPIMSITTVGDSVPVGGAQTNVSVLVSVSNRFDFVGPGAETLHWVARGKLAE